jgi:hypothetical protein
MRRPTAIVLLLAACAAPVPQSPAPPSPQPPVAPAPPPAAAARATLPPGVTERETREGLTQNGAFRIRWESQPSPIPRNQPFTLRVHVTRADAPDAPLPDAELEVNALMPEHGHGMNTFPRTTRQPDGSFLVEGLLFHMRGRWDLIFNARDARGFGQALLTVHLP